LPVDAVEILMARATIPAFPAIVAHISCAACHVDDHGTASPLPALL
jgi:hypothetical protein